MSGSIFETLKSIGMTSYETRFEYSHRTRDKERISVWKDSVSGVVYIDEYYVGEGVYIGGEYRKEKLSKTGRPDYERQVDANRRFKDTLQFVAGKTVLDFGCGSGDYLKLIRHYAASVCGVELQKDYVEELRRGGIDCFSNLDEIPNGSIDFCTSFHVLEHIPDPIMVLSLLKTKIKDRGAILIEVPHANDFLMSYAEVDAFKQFTLWSQHLILHTRDSLRRLLVAAGFRDVVISGVQRYPLSNHVNWMLKGVPGGHKSILSVLDDDALRKEYAKVLAKIDATDTLVAVARA